MTRTRIDILVQSALVQVNLFQVKTRQNKTDCNRGNIESLIELTRPRTKGDPLADGPRQAVGRAAERLRVRQKGVHVNW